MAAGDMSEGDSAKVEEMLAGMSRQKLQALAKRQNIRANLPSPRIIKLLKASGITIADLEVPVRVKAPEPKRARVILDETRDPVAFKFAEAVRCVAREGYLGMKELLAVRGTCKEGQDAFDSMTDEFIDAFVAARCGTRRWVSNRHGREVAFVPDPVAKAILPLPEKVTASTVVDVEYCKLAALLAYGGLSAVMTARRSGRRSRGLLGPFMKEIEEVSKDDTAKVKQAVKAMREKEAAWTQDKRSKRYYKAGGDDRSGIRDAFLRDPVKEKIGLREVVAVRKLCRVRSNGGEYHALSSTRDDITQVTVSAGRMLLREARLRNQFLNVKSKKPDVDPVQTLDSSKFTDLLVKLASRIDHGEYRGYRGRRGYDDDYGGEVVCWRCGGLGHMSYECYYH